MHHPALAGSILGRWKELSLRMKPPSLQIIQGISRPTEGFKNTFWHTGTQCKDENKGREKKKRKKLLRKKPSRKRKGNPQKKQIYTQILNRNELVINAEEEKGKIKKERKRKREKQQTGWTW